MNEIKLAIRERMENCSKFIFFLSGVFLQQCSSNSSMRLKSGVTLVLPSFPLSLLLTAVTSGATTPRHGVVGLHVITEQSGQGNQGDWLFLPLQLFHSCSWLTRMDKGNEQTLGLEDFQRTPVLAINPLGTRSSMPSIQRVWAR
jgi:hypothetical protein